MLRLARPSLSAGSASGSTARAACWLSRRLPHGAALEPFGHHQLRRPAALSSAGLQRATTAPGLAQRCSDNGIYSYALRLSRSSSSCSGPLRSSPVPARKDGVDFFYFEPHPPPRKPRLRIENGALYFPTPGFPNTDFRVDWTWGLYFAYQCLQAAKFGTMAPLVSEGIRAFSILFHEAAHAVAFRHYGAPVTEIGLHFAGGYAATNVELPPRADGVVSFAGPAANFLIAAAAAGTVLYFGRYGMPVFWYKVAMETLSLNVILGALNLLPMPPLDGAGVLRGLISFLPGRLSDPTIAQRLQATIGITCAAALAYANHTWLGGGLFIDMVCVFSALASFTHLRR
eukprot:tig00021726_g23256.t1